jgi:S-adenosylmethionine hydrolase
VKRIITLTTDFGIDDHYAGSMKGVVLGINNEAVITDITHGIPKYDIFKAAYTLRSFYKYFPKGSIHVVVVDPGVGSERKPIIVQTQEGIFIGPDNGVFSFVLKESKSVNVFEITNSEFMLEDLSSTFHGRDIFALVAAHLSLGVDIQDFGEVLKNPISLEIRRPELKGDEIVGEAIYVDSFGNLITNIPGDLLKGYSKVQLGEFIIDSVAKTYQDVEKGKLLAIIGSSGFLEISVNQGSAVDIIKDQKVTIKK